MIPRPDERFVTLAAMAHHLKAMNLAGDVALNECLDSALENVAERVGPLDGAERTVRVYPTPGGSLILPFGLDEAEPVTVSDPDGTAVEPRDVDYEAGIITLGARYGRGRGWSVTAAPAGFTTSVTLAVKIIASHLYEIHRGRDNAGRAMAMIPTADESGVVPEGFAIPRRAAELLEPFERAAVR